MTGDASLASEIEAGQSMQMLVELTQSLRELKSLDDILEQLLATTTRQIGAERTTVFLWDSKSAELYSRASVGGLRQEIRIPDASGLAGAVLHGGDGVIIDDVSRDPRFNASVDELTGYRTRSLMCVPLRTMNGDVIGVTQALNKKTGDFTEEDMRWLTAMTRRAASFLMDAAYIERAGGDMNSPHTIPASDDSARRTLSFGEIATRLKTLPVFRECPATDFARFLSQVGTRTLKPGEVLYDRGAPAEMTYFVVDGDFTIEASDGAVALARRGLLGEESAIGMDFYVSRVAVATAARVLTLPSGATADLASNRIVREYFMASFNGRLIGYDEAGSDSVSRRSKISDATWRETIGWFAALAAPCAIYGSLHRADILPSQESLLMLCILSATAIMWVFRLLPDFVPALFAVLSVVLLGIAPPAVAFHGFVSDGFYMALSILGLSAVIRSSGLSYRALLLMLRLGPSHTAWYNFSLFFIGTVLTPIVPTANGRVAIVAPFVVDLLRAAPANKRTGEAPRLTGNALGGASLLSPMFASSKSVNFVMFGMLPLQLQHQFHWFYWLQASLLCGGVLALLYGAAGWWLFRSSEGLSIPKELVVEQQRLLGRLKPGEWAALLGLAVLVIGFASAAIHRLDIPWIAMAILFCLLMFGFLREDDFRKNIDWSFLVFLGALVGLSDAMHAAGLESWLTTKLSWLGTAMAGDFMVFVLLLAAVMFVIRLALPINATTVILAGLLIPSAVSHGVNPWVIGFLVLLFSESFVWPYQASYFGQFNSITGPIAGADDRRLHTLNMVSAVFKILAVFATIPYWRSLGLL